VGYINNLLRSEVGVQQSIEALLSLTVIDTWSAFEILASDLWIAAVNQGPSKFRQNVNIADQGKPDPSFVKHWGEKLKYDPVANYAESLLETNRVSLRRLLDIKRWYSATFGDSIKPLFKETAAGYIYALSAYRNVLVHNGGKVDKDFVKQIEPVGDLRGTFQEGDQIELDGEVVSKLRNAGIELGQELIFSIDRLTTSLLQA
jgi:hypothetical protein